MDEEGSPGVYESYSPIEGGPSRKRTFSVSEGRGSNAFLQSQTPARSRLPSLGWPTNSAQMPSQGYASASQRESSSFITSPTFDQATTSIGEMKKPFWTTLTTSPLQKMREDLPTSDTAPVSWDENTKES